MILALMLLLSDPGYKHVAEQQAAIVSRNVDNKMAVAVATSAVRNAAPGGIVNVSTYANNKVVITVKTSANDLKVVAEGGQIVLSELISH